MDLKSLFCICLCSPTFCMMQQFRKPTGEEVARMLNHATKQFARKARAIQILGRCKAIAKPSACMLGDLGSGLAGLMLLHPLYAERFSFLKETALAGGALVFIVSTIMGIKKAYAHADSYIIDYLKRNPHDFIAAIRVQALLENNPHFRLKIMYCETLFLTERRLKSLRKETIKKFNYLLQDQAINTTQLSKQAQELLKEARRTYPSTKCFIYHQKNA